jgi:hypothetical protein
VPVALGREYFTTLSAALAAWAAKTKMENSYNKKLDPLAQRCVRTRTTDNRNLF